MDDRYSPVGIELRGDIVSGKQLATSLCTGDGHYPSVVTLATCDSGAVLDVRTTDASIAHDLHDQGITLVVASQYPLTVEGSVPLIDQLYPQLLSGEHPLVALYRVRTRLHSLMAHRNHDWASLVVYEALPPDIDARLEELRYWQARRAQSNALQRLEELVKTAQANKPTQEADWKHRLAQVDDAGEVLPKVGPYVLECEGLRAAADKRVGLAVLNGAMAGAPIEDLKPKVRERLQRSRLVYWRATQGFLGSWQEPGRKKANLHWLLGQVLALDAIWKPDLDAGQLALARMAAETDLQAPAFSDRGWAHISLAEQALLRLGQTLADAETRDSFARSCLDHLQQMVDLCGLNSEQVMSTARQLRRYVNDFGAIERQDELKAILGHFPDHWQGNGGLVETALAALQLMGQPAKEPNEGGHGPDPKPEDSQGPPPESGAAPAQGGGNARLATTASGSSRRAASHLTLEMLSAANGDCLWLEYGDPQCPRRVLIDCGAKATAKQLAPRIAALPKVTGRRPFELFVLTHVDADHINGALPLFDQPGASDWFDDVWFNGTPQMQHFLSVQQGEAFSQRLARPGDPFPWNRAFTPGGAGQPQPVVIRPQQPRQLSLPDGLALTLLSPTDLELTKLSRKWVTALKNLNPTATLGRAASPLPAPETIDLKRYAAEPVQRDPSPANGSSIALLAEFDGQSVLLSGDSYAQVLSASIRALQAARGRSGKPLPLTALKLSHHGSAHATTPELLELVDCHHYLVSTDGSIFQHPDLAALARVVMQGGTEPTLHFNHRNERTAFWADAELQRRYAFHTVLPAAGMAGLTIDVALLARSS
jgi:beta-lactamase superfamily II metal-dependent hydrolase